jgi:flavin reductase (DIM6/NTAB) family NADH-FMN oxidoreductase RutF
MSRPSASAAAFKATMRHYPTGVTVVTSLREGEPRGITLNAFASVSADPPTLLICVNREARSYLYISESKIFCVNLLAADQQHLAERFSGKIREHQFDDVEYEVDLTGSPVLRGTVGHFDCEVSGEHHAGSHSIFIGNVVGCAARAGKPLGYFDGAYHEFGSQIS